MTASKVSFNKGDHNQISYDDQPYECQILGIAESKTKVQPATGDGGDDEGGGGGGDDEGGDDKEEGNPITVCSLLVGMPSPPPSSTASKFSEAFKFSEAAPMICTSFVGEPGYFLHVLRPCGGG